MVISELHGKIAGKQISAGKVAVNLKSPFRKMQRLIEVLPGIVIQCPLIHAEGPPRMRSLLSILRKKHERDDQEPA